MPSGCVACATPSRGKLPRERANSSSPPAAACAKKPADCGVHKVQVDEAVQSCLQAGESNVCVEPLKVQRVHAVACHPVRPPHALVIEPAQGGHTLWCGGEQPRLLHEHGQAGDASKRPRPASRYGSGGCREEDIQYICYWGRALRGGACDEAPTNKGGLVQFGAARVQWQAERGELCPHPLPDGVDRQGAQSGNGVNAMGERRVHCGGAEVRVQGGAGVVPAAHQGAC